MLGPQNIKELLYDPLVPLLSIHTKGLKPRTQIHIYIPKFTAVYSQEPKVEAVRRLLKASRQEVMVARSRLLSSGGGEMGYPLS